jgi:hypothetical protein
MAKISEVVPTIVQKMNTTYQQQIKDEQEAFTFFTS